jgi:hypothetical protein
MLAGAAAVIALSLVRWMPQAWNHLAMLYWQRQCMDYGAPVDQVVYDQLVTAGLPTAAIVPTSWQSYYPRGSTLGLVGSATAFLHRRTDSNGAERLVVVDVLPPIRSQGSLVCLQCRVFTPGTALSRPREGGRQMFNPVLDDRLVDFSTRIRVFTGQPDPADASHFTITIEVDGRMQTLDGWLTRNDYVRLEKRK